MTYTLLTDEAELWVEILSLILSFLLALLPLLLSRG